MKPNNITNYYYYIHLMASFPGQAGCSSWHQTISVKALKATTSTARLIIVAHFVNGDFREFYITVVQKATFTYLLSSGISNQQANELSAMQTEDRLSSTAY